MRFRERRAEAGGEAVRYSRPNLDQVSAPGLVVFRAQLRDYLPDLL